MKKQIGTLIAVENTERKFGSASHYIAVHVSDGKESLPLLFTPAEIQDAMKRAGDNPEDVPAAPSKKCAGIISKILGWAKEALSVAKDVKEVIDTEKYPRYEEADRSAERGTPEWDAIAENTD